MILLWTNSISGRRPVDIVSDRRRRRQRDHDEDRGSSLHRRTDPPKSGRRRRSSTTASNNQYNNFVDVFNINDVETFVNVYERQNNDDDDADKVRFDYQSEAERFRLESGWGAANPGTRVWRSSGRGGRENQRRIGCGKVIKQLMKSNGMNINHK